MKVPRRLLERKLSTLLGADVAIGAFRLALAAGTMEVDDVTVTCAGAAEPALRLPRAKAEVALSKALRKELSVTSVVFERPALAVVQRPDGSLHLPLVPRLGAVAGAGGSTAEENGRAGAGSGRGWRLDVGRVLVVDGEVRFVSTWGPLAGFDVRLGGVLAEGVRTADGYDFTVIMQRANVDGRPVGGEMKGVGRIVPAPAAVASAPGAPVRGDAALVATLTAGRSMEIRVQCESLAAAAAQVEARGDVSLQALLPLLPPALARPAALRAWSGGVHVAASASYDRAAGWNVRSLDLRASDVRFSPPHSGEPAGEPEATSSRCDTTAVIR